jgi:PAS domain S-box-containing protein
MNERATRILLIEDDPGYGRLVREMLTAAGGTSFQVQHVNLLAAACQVLAREGADVVVLDLGLPDSGGLRTFDRVRREAPSVPIVILSHVDDEAVAIEAARRGAQDYLVKGYMDAHALGRAIRYAVERARAEAALNESRRALATLMNNLPGMAYRCKVNSSWTMEFVSSGCVELTGYQPDELIDDRLVSYASLIHPGDRDVGRDEVRQALRENRSFQLSYRIRTAAGREKWVWEQGAAVRGGNGEVVALEGLIIDDSQRLRALQAHRLVTTAIEQGADAVVITDLQGTIQYVNPSFERITGYARAEIVGKNPRVLASGKHDAAFYQELWAKLLRGEVWNGRFINKRKDGSLYRQDATITPVRDATGSIVNYVCVARDVTHEVDLEEQLRQSQKMEAIGQLAGGIAHDFNNLLTAILGNSEMLLASMHAEDERRADLEEIRQAGARAAALTRQLLAFSRRQVLEPVVLDLNEVIVNVTKMIKRLLGEHVELTLDLAEGLGSVHADPGQLEHVIINLAVNARDAMPKGGKLLIETLNADLDETYVASHAPVVPGPYVMIAISDNGVGMDEQTRLRVFEPFFTTKESGKGTGLGLSTVYGIVKQSSGYIWVYSEPGKGTSFKIYLPRVAREERALARETGAQRQAVRRAARGRETALLVEDDEAVRAVVRKTLESSGYTVVEAQSAAEATRLAEQYTGPIDCLITDLIMPETSGRDLAQTVAALRPEIRVLYMSGYSDNAVLRQGILSPEMEFIAKPFTQERLLSKVRHVLDTGAAK